MLDAYILLLGLIPLSLCSVLPCLLQHFILIPIMSDVSIATPACSPFKIGVVLLYNVASFIVQQSESAVCIHMSPSFTHPTPGGHHRALS